jgi:putative transposase
VIEQMKADFGVEFSAAQLGVSVSGYYAWQKRPVSARQAARWDLAAKVLGAFVESGRALGHRKVHQKLAEAGVVVDRKTVAKAMREMRLVPPATLRAWKRAAARRRATPDPVDLVERNFSTTVAPGTVLVGDITYVPTGQGWLYVATVIDLASRMVLGVACGRRQTKQLIIRALKKARATGHVAAEAIFHSDHGRQYASDAFGRFCQKHGIRRSMGARYECWDNAVAESFFSKLKGERLDWRRFTSREEAVSEVTDYVRWFNTQRPHQTLGYATPAAALQRRINPATTTTAAA